MLGALGRGGIQFMLIIWLQGIWLPQHGISFSETPLWAGIAMVPLTVGFLITAPLAGALSDKIGSRLLATAGLVISGSTFLLLQLLPINFNYIFFALLIFLFAIGMGMFFAPNQAAVMNSLPPDQRGAGAGMLNTFQNSATVLSMGLFFTIVTLGLASRLPSALYRGLTAQGVNPAAAHLVANEPPIGSLFSAFLGYNPIKQLLGPTGALQHMPAKNVNYITGRSFFPSLIEQPFAGGLHLAFTFAAIATVIAIIASAVRPTRYLHTSTQPITEELAEGAAEAAVVTGLDESAAVADLDGASSARGNGNGRLASSARTDAGEELDASHGGGGATA
jgi:MFS family permease